MEALLDGLPGVGVLLWWLLMLPMGWAAVGLIWSWWLARSSASATPLLAAAVAEMGAAR
ncbi:MAG: hypothetical protein KA754_09145 [Corallincola sp.]|nr:hypothetical protein [Corallincola sp.]